MCQKAILVSMSEGIEAYTDIHNSNFMVGSPEVSKSASKS
jgi:hypothetical protein